MVIEPPLVVIDGQDIMLFSSADALTSKLEPLDIRAGTYAVFDSRGRTIELGVREGRVERVVIGSVDSEAGHEQQLRAGLIDGLVAGFAEAPDHLRSRTLAQLVALAIARLGYVD